MVKAGIGAVNNLTDSRLVEASITIIPFKDFEVRSEGPVTQKGVGLFLSDPCGFQKFFHAFRTNSPPFSCRKALLQEGEVRERSHAFDAEAGQLGSRFGKVKLTFQMMHSGFKQGFTMQTAPQSNGAETRGWPEWLMCEVASQFFRCQVNVCENNCSADRMFQHLRAPAGTMSG
jgi:hypothetical protein